MIIDGTQTYALLLAKFAKVPGMGGGRINSILAMPAFWVHMVPQPIPKPRNLSHSSVPPTHEHGGHVHVADHSSSIWSSLI